jgi:hypothetical protein
MTDMSKLMSQYLLLRQPLTFPCRLTVSFYSELLEGALRLKLLKTFCGIRKWIQT